MPNFKRNDGGFNVIPVIKEIKNDKPDRIWVTKWALSKGILEFKTSDFDFLHSSRKKSMRIKLDMGIYEIIGFEDWFLTKEVAIEKAERMKAAKISTYSNTINKLNNLFFS